MGGIFVRCCADSTSEMRLMWFGGLSARLLVDQQSKLTNPLEHESRVQTSCQLSCRRAASYTERGAFATCTVEAVMRVSHAGVHGDCMLLGVLAPPFVADVVMLKLCAACHAYESRWGARAAVLHVQFVTVLLKCMWWGTCKAAGPVPCLESCQ
jgi:hypothetical protein